MGRLYGERVTLREFRSEDISGIRSWVTDGETTRFLSGVFMQPHTWEQSEHYLNGLLNGDAGGAHFVIADREDLRYLGQCDLFMLDNTGRKAELSIVLAPENAGKGYGREAIRLLTAFAFDQMNLNRVYLKAHADNERALRCYEACGFRREGVLREDIYADGAYRDVVVMGLLRRER